MVLHLIGPILYVKHPTHRVLWLITIAVHFHCLRQENVGTTNVHGDYPEVGQLVAAIKATLQASCQQEKYRPSADVMRDARAMVLAGAT